MGDAVQVLVPAAVIVPPPIWLGGAPQLGAGLLASFFDGRTSSPSTCLGRLGRSLCCALRPPSVVGLVVVAPAPSVVHRDSAPQLGFPPPSEVLHLVGVFQSAVAVPCYVVLFLLLVSTSQFVVWLAFLVQPTAFCLPR